MIEYYLVGGLIWFFLCITIGTLTNHRNKWGSDAVENYCNQHEDTLGAIGSFIWGLLGAMVIIIIGILIEGFPI